MKFSERLKELLEEADINEVAESLNLQSATILYQWQDEKRHPRLNSLIKLANYFQCTLDYLLGRSEDNSIYKIKQTKDFETQLKKVVKENNKTLYKLVKDGIISKGNTYDWFHDKSSPSMDKILSIANYLNVSVDHLVGRE